jgi:hypothetical protein
MDQQLADADRAVRVSASRELATQLEAAAELAEQLDLVGWSRHFRRDAELLRMRADREARGE